MGDSNQILSEMEPIFQSVLGKDDLKLTANLKAGDVPGWDSMKHIQLLVAVEDHFKTRLDMMAVATLNNVGELAQLVAQSQS